ncbi:MAG TPA: GNAT family N-acetyltransferase [Candidatus Sulfotelmatobacter sp.]|nr:GNAT family N-acetyltransferase [Candidatus Sulfotelmatobacter sp.]
MTPALVVRRGGRADRDFVRDLGRRSASSSISAVRDARFDDVLLAFERLTEFVYARRHDVLIAEENGERVGFLLLLYDIPDEVTLTEQAFVAYTAVEPFARGRGVGRALLDLAEDCARELGLGYVSLMVTEDNEPARRLYDGAGYGTERRMMTKRL